MTIWPLTTPRSANSSPELKPVGLLETKAVQTLADTYWRLDRIRAMENNLFALGFEEQSGLSSDPAIDCALAQAKSLDRRGDLLAASVSTSSASIEPSRKPKRN